MFASPSLTIHLARGLLGLGALAASVALSNGHALLSLALLPVGLVALRGCPMCWTLGLVETVSARLRGKTAADACVDGRCSRVS